MTDVGEGFFVRPAREVASDLVGCGLTCGAVSGVIVEVERYEQWDAASHSFRGPHRRAQVMFGPAGRLYVYRSYGIHWCMNVVCGADGEGAAVLIRAVEPTAGLDVMRERRGGVRDADLCRGPGRVAQAFAITGDHDGVRLGTGAPRESVWITPRATRVSVVRTPRIGITKDAGRRWRYSAEGSAWTSGRRTPRGSDRERVAA